MSRPNRNKKFINFASGGSNNKSRNSSGSTTKNQRASDSRCSSSGSEDGDTVRNNATVALDLSKKSPVASGVSSDDGDATRAHVTAAPPTAATVCVETDVDLVRMLLTGGSASLDTPANVKLARVCAFNSNESEWVLIVDTPANHGGTARKMFKLTDQLVEKLRDKGLRLYEWRTYQRLSEIVDQVSTTTTKEEEKPPPPPPPPPPPKRSAEIEPEEESKKLKCSLARVTDNDDESVASPVDSLTATAKKLREQCGGMSAAEQRTRVLQQFLREYSRMGARKAQQPKMVQLKNCSMAITDTECCSVDHQQQQQQQQQYRRSGRSRWNDFSILRNIGGVNLLVSFSRRDDVRVPGARVEVLFRETRVGKGKRKNTMGTNDGVLEIESTIVAKVPFSASNDSVRIDTYRPRFSA